MLSGLVTADMDGRVLTFNRAAAAITGLSTGQAVGHDIGDVLQLPPAFRSRLQTLGETRSQRADHQYRSPDGRLLDIGMTATTLSLPDGRSGYLFTFQDVTDTRRLERGARLQQRMAAVGEMAAGIAHEIRNPLASMSGSIQVLRQELPLSDDQAQLMDIVLRESERLNETIRSFLAYARPQRFTFTRLDVRRVVRDTAMLLRNSADVRDDHIIDMDLPDDPVSYEADENQIRQIVWNLATNGLRAMSTGGRLVLSARTEREGEHEEVNITVHDQGCGIPPAELDSLFQPFHSSFEKGTASASPSSTASSPTTTDRSRCRPLSDQARRSGCGSRCGRPSGRRPRSTRRLRPATGHRHERAIHARQGRGAGRVRRDAGAGEGAHSRRRRRAVDAGDAAHRAPARRLRGADRRKRPRRHRAAAQVASRSPPVGHQDARHHRRRGAARRQGNQQGHRRVHDDGVCVHEHRRRGDAAGRRGLLHQAVQHGRTAAEDPAASRDHTPLEAGERPAEKGAEDPLRVLEHHRPPAS